MPLDRVTVVRTALRLLDEVGLDQLTLRRIATELHVQAPALYWHFRNKRELLEAMAATVLDDAVADRDGWLELTWQDFLRTYAHALRHALLRYRDGARMVPGTYMIDNRLYGVIESALHNLTWAGFSPATASLALSATYSYTVGYAIEQQAIHPYVGPASGPRKPPPVESDEHFDQGLRLIIVGLEGQLATRQHAHH